jgi:hypothetical protein
MAFIFDPISRLFYGLGNDLKLHLKECWFISTSYSQTHVWSHVALNVMSLLPLQPAEEVYEDAQSLLVQPRVVIEFGGNTSYDENLVKIWNVILHTFLLLSPFPATVNVDLNKQRYFKRLTFLDNLINVFVIQVPSTGLMPNRWIPRFINHIFP